MSKLNIPVCVLFLLLMLLIPLPTVVSQTKLEIVTGAKEHERSPGESYYHYRFENQRFTTQLQELEFDASGHGVFRFKRKDETEIVNQLQVTATVLEEINSIFSELNFLSGSADYQHKKDFSHLGKTTISLRRGGKERVVILNYTENPAMSRLIQIFRNIATQENRIFEIETIRLSDSISIPAQLRLLEGEFKSGYIADPQRFVPLLNELKLDEAIPLIARNHAERLLQMIKKGKW